MTRKKNRKKAGLKIKRAVCIFWLKRIKRRFDVNLKKVAASAVKLDVFIPVAEKDLDVLPYVIDGARKNIKHPIGEIIIAGPDSDKIKALCAEKKCRFVNEGSVLPIDKKDVKLFIDSVNRSGWLFQQFLKLSGDIICSQNHYLILDADTVLVRPQVFIHREKTLLNCSKEYHRPYFAMYEKLLGRKPLSPISFVCHYMLFEKDKVRKLKTAIEEKSGTEWYSAIQKAGDSQATFSEYETYGNFVLANHPRQVITNYCFNLSLSKNDLPRIDTMKNDIAKCFKSVSFHSYNN